LAKDFGSKVETKAYTVTTKVLRFLGRAGKGVGLGVYDVALKPAGQGIAKSWSNFGEDEETPTE
jgi:hypothetical protein